MIFIDASAFVAIIAQEPGFADLTGALEPQGRTICSALSIWETTAALCRTFRYPVAIARATVTAYVRDLEFRYVPIGEHEAELAAEAYAKFGKGRHTAALNMGDCFAYACARANNAKLLFKGDDFSKTDIAAA